MLCLSGFELYSRWVPLVSPRSSPTQHFDQKTRKLWTNLYLEPRNYRIYYVNIDLRLQCGISPPESQTFLRAKRPHFYANNRDILFWKNDRSFDRGETDVFAG